MPGLTAVAAAVGGGSAGTVAAGAAACVDAVMQCSVSRKTAASARKTQGSADSSSASGAGTDPSLSGHLQQEMLCPRVPGTWVLVEIRAPAALCEQSYPEESVVEQLAVSVAAGECVSEHPS